MVAIQYEYHEGSSVTDYHKPKQNYVIPAVFVICIIITSCLVGYLVIVYTPAKRLVCYYNFPTSSDDLQPEEIDAFLCTHIIVGFANVSAMNEINVDGKQLGIIKRLLRLKEQNNSLKVLLSVRNDGSDSYLWSQMVLNHRNRKSFIKSVYYILKQHLLDGVDLDWEYPNALGVNKTEKICFTQLLEEIRMHIEKHSYKYLLSVAVPSLIFRIDASYQVNYLNQFTDFINVMSYDYHFFSNLTPFTGLNAPLLRSSLDNGVFSSMNINNTIAYYQSQGMDGEKINVGLPTYAHTFTLFNQDNNGLYSPAENIGKIGSNGFANYPQVCEFLSMQKVLKYFDSATKSPYATKHFQWISYDNAHSLSLKTQFFANHKVGFMIYSLNADDFKGVYGEKFALVRAVKKAIS